MTGLMTGTESKSAVDFSRDNLLCRRVWTKHLFSL